MIKHLEDYLNKREWRIKENANQIYSFPHCQRNISKFVMAEYALQKVYSPEIAQAHREKFLHIHDLGELSGYCAGWSLYNILLKGFPHDLPNCSASYPPRHFSSALAQLANFIGCLSLEWAGAQAVNHFDTLLAPFIAVDKLTRKEVKQKLQEFIYNINTVSRFGESPFTNITLDFSVPKDIADFPIIISGKPWSEWTYGNWRDAQYYINVLNHCLLELLIEGDARGRPFTFPIVTINITKDFFEKIKPSIKQLLYAWVTSKGGPYFTNFVNSDLNPEDIRSMCCHLQISRKELQKHYTGGLFGAADQTGSLGVMDINLPLLAQNSNTVQDFYTSLVKYVKMSCEALIQKRHFIDELWRKNFFPFSKRYLRNLNSHFLTVSTQGGWEAYQILEPPCSYLNFALNIKDYVMAYLKKYQKNSGYLFNYEVAPGEGTSFRFASALKNYDKKYITQGLNLPVDYSDKLEDYLGFYDVLLPHFTGGSIFHIFTDEQAIIGNKLWTMMGKILATRIPYFTITPTFYYCPGCQRTYRGNKEICPFCGSKTQVFSRIVGYYRPTQNWNEGKYEEFFDRESIK